MREPSSTKTALEPETVPCSIQQAWNILGNKWAFFVLRELYTGPLRFSQLKRALPGINPKSLTATLRHLEKQGMIMRNVFPSVPVTVQYRVSEKGESFHRVLYEMKRWGAMWADAASAAEEEGGGATLTSRRP